MRDIATNEIDPITVGAGTAPRVSAVVPMYNEYDNVAPLVEALRDGLEAAGETYEVVLVDDGSSDDTASAIRDIAKRDPTVRGVYLARNYGQSTAMQAGFDHARGALVVTLDGDLQNDPKDIARMIGTLEDEEVDVVSGWRLNRQDGPTRKFFSRVANRLIGRMTGVEVHDFGCSLRVYRREYLERVRLYGEMHRFLPALLAEVGASIREIEVNHHPRRAGHSKYSLDRTFRVVLDLLLVMFFRRYLQRPIHVFGGAGIMTAVPGGAILVYLFFLKVMTGAAIGDRPLLSLGILLVVIGVMLIGQGILGELMSRTYYESGERPQYHAKLDRETARNPKTGPSRGS